MPLCCSRLIKEAFMKKITSIIAIALFGCCLLSGCSDNLPFVQTKPDFSSGYTIFAEINCGKLEAAADIAYIAENDWEFTFTEPKALAGIKLMLNEEGLSGKLGALDFSVDENGQYTLLPEIIAKAVAALAKTPAEKRTVSDGIITVETEFNEKPVTITADTSGKLISLKCPYYSLSVNFSNQNKITVREPSDSSDENSGEEPTVTISPV